MAESKNFFASPTITDFYVVSGDGYQTYVFVSEIQTVSDAKGNSWGNTRVDGSTVALELVVNETTKKIVNSQISIS